LVGLLDLENYVDGNYELEINNSSSSSSSSSKEEPVRSKKIRNALAWIEVSGHHIACVITD
jgi:hypothetical protein